MATFSPRFLELERLSADDRAALLRRADQDIEPMLERVRPIVEAVRREGDAALFRSARELDGVKGELQSLVASEAEIAQAYEQLSDGLIEAIRFAIAHIRAFHERQNPSPCGCTRSAPVLLPVTAGRPFPLSRSTCRAARERFPRSP